MNKFLKTVSIIAVIGSTTVFAMEDQSAKEAMAEETSEKYEELKTFIFGNEKDKLEITMMNVEVDHRAENIVGKPVYNLEERVGTVHDIILDGNGNAVMAVIADGELFGLGKLVAFDYERLVENQLDDKFLVSISEDTIDQVAEFSYIKKDAGNNVRVIPQNGYSIKNLLNGELTNNNGDAIAEIDDVYLEDGKASHLIVDFEDVYFDETVAVEYEIAEIVTHEDDYNFQLLSPREVQLENFRQTRLN